MDIIKSKFFLYITSFVAGFITLSLEILGFRMLAPYFGYSIYISGSLIGIILVSLALGYYLGGILADKKPDINFMFKLILISDIYIFIMALVYNPILNYFSNFNPISGTVISTLIIFAVPMVLLSTVSPYLVKLISSKKTVGKVSGRISALSTLGNIVGVFITTFLFIPKLGTHKTIYISAILLLIISVYWLYKTDKKYLLSFIIILLINPNIAIESNFGKLIYSEESEYNLVKVVENSDNVIMILNNEKWFQSMLRKDNILTYNFYDFFNLAPLLTEGNNVLVLGMGSGTSVVQLRNFFPELNIDAVEIDPKVVETSHRFFNLPRDDEKLKIHIEDARSFVKKTNKKYDIAEIDIYNGDIYIPFYLVTEEFFQGVKDRMTENGVLIMNSIVIEESKYKDNVADAVSNTIVSVFPSTFLIRLPHNTIIIATKKQNNKEDIINKLRENKIKDLNIVVDIAIEELEEIKYDDKKVLLKDDLSPIDQLTYEMYRGSR